MNIQKRIKRIISLTVEDFYNYGFSTNESDESLKSWLLDELLKDEFIEDCSTIEISLKVLQMLKSLDLVDLEFIHNILFEDMQKIEVTLSIDFDGVQL